MNSIREKVEAKPEKEMQGGDKMQGEKIEMQGEKIEMQDEKKKDARRGQEAR